MCRDACGGQTQELEGDMLGGDGMKEAALEMMRRYECVCVCGINREVSCVL